MSRPVVPTCDECGRAKQEVNHWWMLMFSLDRPQTAIHLFPSTQTRYLEGLSSWIFAPSSALPKPSPNG